MDKFFAKLFTDPAQPGERIGLGQVFRVPTRWGKVFPPRREPAYPFDSTRESAAVPSVHRAYHYFDDLKL